MEHLDFEKLVEYSENLLSVSDKQEVLKHLQICTDCAIHAKKLEYFFSYSNKGNHEQVPQTVTANLLNIFQPKKNDLKTETFGKRLLAILAFDDWQIALNERLVYSDTRQLLYKTEKFDIDIRLQFAGGKCLLSGQVLPDCKKGLVEIHSREFTEKADLDSYSEFAFAQVKEGIYDLRFNLDDTIVEIKNFSLLANP